MTILQVNKYYYPRGGADVVMLELAKLLEARGHQIVPLAMQHPQNLASPYAHSFVSEVETESVRFGWQGIRTAARMLYSVEARRKISSLIRTTKPELAHLHNIYHQISPSILTPLKKAGIPVVMSVHDWALISPNYSLFDHGEICERGMKNPWDIIEHRCIKDSKVASAWAAFVFWMHKKLRLYEKGVDRFIAPAEFVKEKLVVAGIDQKKIEVIHHFIDATKISPSDGGDYIGYIGRLSPEKGVEVLLRAATKTPEIPVKIAGTGPDEARLRSLTKELGLKNVEFVGWLDGVMRARFYGHAAAIVVPSVWYEIFGMIVLESYAAGKPVIASRIGALPELVREGETGFLFRPGDADQLADQMRLIFGEVGERRRMGAAARAMVEQEYNPEQYYEQIMKLYASLV